MIAVIISETAKHIDSSVLSTQNTTDTVQAADRASISSLGNNICRTVLPQHWFFGISCLPPIVISDDKNSHYCVLKPTMQLFTQALLLTGVSKETRPSLCVPSPWEPWGGRMKAHLPTSHLTCLRFKTSVVIRSFYIN